MELDHEESPEKLSCHRCERALKGERVWMTVCNRYLDRLKISGLEREVRGDQRGIEMCRKGRIFRGAGDAVVYWLDWGLLVATLRAVGENEQVNRVFG